ncbi:uncharacterized protein LOC144163645 [Haemaphysalis longicornis]
MAPGATGPPDVTAGRTPHQTAPLASSSCNMDVVEVEGEAISPEDFENDTGWLSSHRKRSGKALARLNLAQNDSQRQPGTGSASSVSKTPEPKRKQAIRLPRQPRLPKEDIKIVLRPRDGLDVAKLNDAQIRDGVLSAAAIKKEEAEDDLPRTSPKQNIIVVSTPKMAHAEKYNGIRQLCFGKHSYEITAYAAPPEDTTKGVIHNIPDYDTADDITRSLVYKKNPAILQARRMGKTNSVIIVFEGRRVPYYVYYRGAEYRCFLHKKKHEFCTSCGRLGHRADVCPQPDKPFCKSCNLENPPDNHVCELNCAICGEGHTTGDKKCRKRFKTPFLLKQRQWEKQHRGSRPKESSTDRSNTDNGAGPEGHHREARIAEKRSRSGSFPRLPPPAAEKESTGGRHRSRSKSRHREEKRRESCSASRSRLNDKSMVDHSKMAEDAAREQGLRANV